MQGIATIHDGRTCRIKVDGRLAGIWVGELRSIMFRHKPHSPIEIDITEVTFVDEEGEHLIEWMHQTGARFRCGGEFSDLLCKRLAIPTFEMPGFRPGA